MAADPSSSNNNMASRWAQVVRGEAESVHGGGHQSPSSSSSSSVGHSVLEQTPFSDCSTSKADPSSSSPSPPPPPTTTTSDSVESSNGNNGIGVGPKKAAWNKPSNGAVEAGSVMGGDSWPALSESTKASLKQSADSSSKPLPDGSASPSQGPVKTHSPRKQANSNANPNSTPNQALPTRQRSMKHGGGGGNRAGPSNSNFSHHAPQPPPPPPVYPFYRLATPNAYGSLMPDPSARGEPSFRGTRPAAGFVSQSHPINDHRNFSRRGNFGSHPHGDGAYHNNYGGRRDQDRGNFANTRDPHMQPPRGPPLRGFARPAPPNAPPFMAQSIRNPMGFQDVFYVHPLPYESIRPVSYINHPHPSPPPAPIQSLPTLLVNQIDYYFSDANLVRDEFLRSNMDEQGWVPISLIATFRRVRNLTSNIQLIANSLRASSVVEVQDDKIRKRNDWMRWLPTSVRLSAEPGLVSPVTSSNNLLATSLQQITLEEATLYQNTDAGEAALTSEHATENSLTESTSQSPVPNGDITQNAQNTHLS